MPGRIMFGPVHFIIGFVLLALGVLLGIWIRKQAEKKAELTIADAEQKALQIENDAHKRAESKSKEMLLEAKEEIMRVRNESEKENKERRADLQKQERRLQQKEENIDRKLENLEKREKGLQKREQSMDEKHREIDSYIQKQVEELERISGYTKDEAKHIPHCMSNEIEKKIENVEELGLMIPLLDKLISALRTK